MISKKFTYGLSVLLFGLMSVSCSEENMPDGDDIESADNSGIIFHVSLSAAESRSATTTVAGDLNGGFHVSAICPEVDAVGALNPYLAEQFAMPIEATPGYFGIFDRSDELWMWPSTRHGKEGRLKFFAFYPSCEAMRESAGVDSKYFGLANKSTKSSSKVTYDYRIEKFKVNKDISRHIDFVTATTEGTRKADAESGVRLDFEHQLSRVVLKAWGNTANDIEIAGVRIGLAITESDFNFAAKPTNLATGDATVSGNWIAPQKRDCVEYIFREGDTVVRLGRGNHTSEASAASIMGNGGCAMVIPAYNTGWNHTKDAPNKNQGLYFSVLLRVKQNDDNNTLMYPYIQGADMSSSVKTDEMTVIYFSIEKDTEKIIRKLYKKIGEGYFTDPECTKPYHVPETEEIRNYGWAAVPLTDLLWKPGYQYTYTLDYSNGVGVHDPADPYPGKPIISSILVGVTQNGKVWPMVYDFTAGGEVDVTNDIIIK